MGKCIRIASCFLVIVFASAGNAAEDLSGEEMRSLDEQVQVVKSDALSIAAELGRLEEKLLYPSNTQVSVFLALDGGDAFRLDSMELQINSNSVATHIYSFKELEALQKGGVQRLYTGNLTTGQHLLSVAYSGKLENGKEVSGAEEFAFDKGVDPELLGLTLTGSASGDSRLTLGDW